MIMRYTIVTDKIFIDTEAFIALADMDDKYHLAAVNCFSRLLASQSPLMTSNFIVDETYTRLRRLLGSKAALRFGESLKAGANSIEIATITEDVEEIAWDFLKKFSDQDLSYTDATSFALMKLKKTKEVFGFGQHFRLVGAILLPQDTGRLVDNKGKKLREDELDYFFD